MIHRQSQEDDVGIRVKEHGQHDETYIGEPDGQESEEDGEGFDSEYSQISKTLDTEMR